MIYRLILPQWAKEKFPNRRKILEGEFTDEELLTYNTEQYYNVHYLPNYPSHYQKGVTVEGSHIDVFHYVYVDMDLKDGTYEDKEEFILTVMDGGLKPSTIVDSGNGVHVYWRVLDLDPMSFLKLQRRLCRHFKTDEAVAKIFQLMRPAGFINTKHQDGFKLVEQLFESDATYTCEDLDKWLKPLTHEDEDYCKSHYQKTYSDGSAEKTVIDKIPLKFAKLVRENPQVQQIWAGITDDRSKSDFRLGHIMFANGFTKDEAMSVLVNSEKALARAPKHRIGYAAGIVDQIWTFELEAQSNALDLSESVRQILSRSGDTLKGTRFPCHSYLDSTEHGFRLGHVIGLVAGSGVGKTAMALNMFMGFVKANPDYDHFFIPLEQKAEEIADRWKTMCGDQVHLHEKVQVISNYKPESQGGGFRHLSFGQIKEYILKYQKITGRKVGSVVIDHIGALKKKGASGENQDIMDICHEMKAFAVETNTMMVMQSQAPREKAGIGDLELNKDAAYGTVYFESYCDYLITIWQPLKRAYIQDGCPTITAFKFCKIRHKKQGIDKVQEDVPYLLVFDPKTEHMREMTQVDKKSFDYFNAAATNKRKQDRKTDLVVYTTINWTNEEQPDEREADNRKDAS